MQSNQLLQLRRVLDFNTAEKKTTTWGERESKKNAQVIHSFGISQRNKHSSSFQVEYSKLFGVCVCARLFCIDTENKKKTTNEMKPLLRFEEMFFFLQHRLPASLLTLYTRHSFLLRLLTSNMCVFFGFSHCTFLFLTVHLDFLF